MLSYSNISGGLAALLVSLVALTFVATDAHAARTGTVLTVNRASHVMRVVEAGEARRYRVSGKIPRAARLGSRVRYAVAGKRLASSVRMVGQGSRVRVRARVMRAKRGKSLQLGDGGGLPRLRPAVRRLATPAFASATSTVTVGDVTVSLSGFQVGEEISITIVRQASGAVKVDIELTRCCNIPLSPEPGDRFSVTGTVDDPDPTGDCDYIAIDTERGGLFYYYEMKFARRFMALHYGDVIRLEGRYIGDPNPDDDEGIIEGPWIEKATVLARRPHSKPFGVEETCLDPEYESDEDE